MTDVRLLGKIDGPFLCLTAAMLCHSLRCWRTGILSIKWFSRVLMPEVR